jgi:hypothetical protein
MHITRLRLCVPALVAGAMALLLVFAAVGEARRGGGGGGAKARPSKPAARPSKPAARPSTPAARPSKPAARPSTPSRPATRPARPARPGGSTGGNVSVSRPNVSGDRDWNVNHNVDVNVDYDHGWGWDHPWATGAAVGTAAAITSAAIGSTVYSLPPACGTAYAGGVMYYSCGGNYYLPSYQGSTVVYQVVAPPA